MSHLCRRKLKLVSDARRCSLRKKEASEKMFSTSSVTTIFWGHRARAHKFAHTYGIPRSGVGGKPIEVVTSRAIIAYHTVITRATTTTMKLHENISPDLQSWIEKQHVFFVGTAPLSGDGHVNLSIFLPRDMTVSGFSTKTLLHGHDR